MILVPAQEGGRGGVGRGEKEESKGEDPGGEEGRRRRARGRLLHKEAGRRRRRREAGRHVGSLLHVVNSLERSLIKLLSYSFSPPPRHVNLLFRPTFPHQYRPGPYTYLSSRSTYPPQPPCRDTPIHSTLPHSHPPLSPPRPALRPSLLPLLK